MLSNLLSNSIKFTAEGGVDVIAHTQAMGEERVYLKLSVRDTGAGISHDEQQQLFKPFSQTPEDKRQIGSGLGLVICREMVERMAGQISITSHAGHGNHHDDDDGHAAEFTAAKQQVVKEPLGVNLNCVAKRLR